MRVLTAAIAGIESAREHSESLFRQQRTAIIFQQTIEQLRDQAQVQKLLIRKGFVHSACAPSNGVRYH